MIPHIPGLQKGWKVLEIRRSAAHPREAVVLCERDPHKADEHCQFVVWSANMIEGGCTGGYYAETYDKAHNELAFRAMRLL